MRYIFRKYISNRGSALFMVISTMTALMVSCMAMYFSMVSARASQYAVFNQMQANQTAQSIADTIYNSMANTNNAGMGGDLLRQKMLELEVGESITTDANGFKSLDPTAGLDKEDEDQLGAYAVTITRLKDVNGNPVFDITVMSSVGGNRDAVHFKIDYNLNETPDPDSGEDGGGGDAELFAATGYVPNDAYISGGYYLTDVFYDTQFTYMNMFTGSGENRIAQNLSTGGDLMIGPDAMTVVHSHSGDSISNEEVNKIGPVTWAIRGNFYPQFGSDFGMRGGSQVLVGGDYTFDSGNNSFYVKNDGYNGTEKPLADHICVYVNGDLNYSGSDIKSNVWFFVNGDVYGVGNNKQSNARLFVTGATAEKRQAKMHCSTNLPVEEWKIDAPFSEGLSYNDAMELLGQKTQTIDYYKWDLSKNTEGAQEVDLRLNATSSPYTDEKGTIGANESTFIFAYDNNVSSASLLKANGGKENGVVGNAFVIKSVLTHGDNNNGQAIIIDTGDDPNNIMTIKLSDVTGNGEFSWFADQNEEWGAEHKVWFGTPTGMINNNMRLVLVKGRGTVLIDVPKGITYQDAGFQQTGHIGWWLIEGGKITTNEDGHLKFSGLDPQGKYSAKLVPYVHRVCTPGDGCTATPEKSSTAKCNKCGGYLTEVTCAIHGSVNKYCAACYPEKATRTDWCKNHVDNKKFDEFYNTLSGAEKDAVTDKDGKIIYPNTNFMLVSCDESAEMLFSETKSGQNITNNTLFGFIYAPYMSYLAAGDVQAGGLVKLLGGMTVGDYDIRAIHSYIGCYPDKMPNEIAGMEGGGSIAGGKLKGTTKSWKIGIAGY